MYHTRQMIVWAFIAITNHVTNRTTPGGDKLHMVFALVATVIFFIYWILGDRAARSES